MIYNQGYEKNYYRICMANLNYFITKFWIYSKEKKKMFITGHFWLTPLFFTIFMNKLSINF